MYTAEQPSFSPQSGLPAFMMNETAPPTLGGIGQGNIVDMSPTMEGEVVYVVRRAIGPETYEYHSTADRRKVVAYCDKELAQKMFPDLEELGKEIFAETLASVISMTKIHDVHRGVRVYGSEILYIEY